MTDSTRGRSSGSFVVPTVLLFFVSGISGLVYQVIWVRQFGNVFGNTVHSASLVTSVFMCGLGVGSYFVGRWSDRRAHGPRDALTWYGFSEVAIALLGWFLAVAIPKLTPLSALISSYERASTGWYELTTGSWLIRYIVAVVLLAPSCILMGGTLTLLIRALVVPGMTSTAWRVGLLFGLNTGGAALGALSTDYWLVPNLGLFDTQLVAVVFNLVAGIGALALARSGLTWRAPSATHTATDEPLGKRAHQLLRRTASALALLGFAAMGLEILWFRYLSQLLGSERAVFSLLLATLLVGMWLGSMSAGWLHRRFGRAPHLFMMTQGALILVTLATLVLIDHRQWLTEHIEVLARGPGGPVAEAWSRLRPIAIIVFAPGFLLGFAYPLANAHVQTAAGEVGRRAGLLYLANTFGNVLGSAVTGFVFLPALGVTFTLQLLLGIVFVSMLPMWLSRSDEGYRPVDYVVALEVLAAAAAIIVFSSSGGERLLAPNIPSSQRETRKLLSRSEGVTETIAVMDVPGVERQLYTNGHPMSGNGGIAQRFMRSYVHIPLLQRQDPKAVLVICFGVGNTAHAASLHPTLERIHIADLSEHVLSHAPFFEATNHGVLDDPRVSVFVNDGRHHLLMQPEGSYDLITLDPPPITFAGVSALYTQEFYALAKSRLAAGGYVTQWLPAYQTDADTVVSLVKSFVNVFPESVLLSGFDKELIMVGTNGEIELDLDLFAARRRASPKVDAELDRIAVGTELELAGMFLAGPETLAEVTAPYPPVTDDLPLIEYSATSRINQTRMPEELLATDGVEQWCRDCLERIPRLAAYLDFLGRYYQTERFLVNGVRPEEPPMVLPDALEDHPYLRHMLEGDGYHAKRKARAHLAAGDFEAATAALWRAAYLNDSDPEVPQLMGETFLASGDPQRGLALLSQAVAMAPTRARGHIALASGLRHQKMLVDAETAARRAVELDPDEPDTHYELAAVLAARGQRAASNQALRTALTLSPAHPKANNVLCKRQFRQGALDSAVRHCDASIAGGVAIPAEIERAIAPHRQ